MSESIEAKEEDESVKVKVDESASIKANEDHHILEVKVEETEVKNTFVVLKAGETGEVARQANTAVFLDKAGS